MRPVKLVMSAFGPYASRVEVDFEELGSEGIYLLCGDTGAGKTTVFDALSYALFGLPSGQDRSLRTLRSDFADPTTPTYVELWFIYRDERYRVRRNPAYERPAKRGGGTTQQEPRAEFEGPDGVIATTVPTVTSAVEELLGINRSQFGQIVMIAQGDFRRLLNADTKERAEIFRRIFGTEAFEDAQRRLEGRRKELYAKAARLRTEVDALVGAVSLREDAPQAAAFAELAERGGLFAGPAASLLESALANDEGALAEQESLAHAATEQVGVLERAAERAERGAAVRRELANLQAKQQELYERLPAAERACQQADEQALACPELDARAAELQQAAARYEQLEEARDALNVNEKLHREACTHSEQGARQLAQTKAQADGLEARRDGLADATAERARAEHALEAAQAGLTEVEAQQRRVAELEAHEAQVGMLEAAHESALATRCAAEKALDVAKTKHAAAKELAASLSCAGQQEAEAEAAHERLAQAQKTLSREREALRELAHEHELAGHALEDAVASQRTAQEAHDGAAQVWLEASRRFYAGQAGLLARELQPGHPCPVCGSPEHPHPASFDGTVPTQEGIDALERERKQAESALAAASAEAAARREALNDRSSSLAAFVRGYPDAVQLADGAPDRSTIEKAVLALDAHFAARSQALDDEAAAAEYTLQEAHRRVAEAENARIQESGAAQRLDTATTELETVAQAYSQTATELAAGRARLDTARSQGPVPDAATVAARLAAATEQKAAASKALEAAGRREAEHAAVCKELAELRELIGRLEQEQPALGAKAAALATETARARSRLDTLLETLPYPSREQAAHAEQEAREHSHALREAAEAAKRSLDAARERLHALEAQVCTLEAELAANDYPDLATSAQALDEARRARDAQERTRAAVFARIQANRKILAQLRANERAAGHVDEQYGELESLANTANGRLSGKDHISFETYVQTAYFDRMLAAANRRLDVMTNGRYELVRRSTGTTQRGQTGLDLDVLDNYTGRSREASSLSGGESFKASLALALGLSDVAQAHAGGIQLDAMFIDEGFGSLDQESLQLAIKTLTELSGTGRLVGIISHVEELKESIDRKIVVQRGREGSTLHIEV